MNGFLTFLSWNEVGFAHVPDYHLKTTCYLHENVKYVSCKSNCYSLI